MAKSKFRRGFKTEANDLSRDLRRELGLEAHNPLCPWSLADHLAVRLFTLTNLAALTDLSYLMGKGKADFSAVVLFEGPSAFIVYNDRHAQGRQASNIAHELAHILLGHPPGAVIQAGGTRGFEPEHEDEANWLGPALLVSEEAALHVVRQGWSVPEAAALYSVSPDVMRMRINVTAARKRVSL